MADLKGYEQLQARLHAIEGASSGIGAMRMLGTAAVAEQKLLVHRKTGTTGRTIHVGSVSASSVTIEAAAAARWLEFGTKPHIIRPRVARVLAWASGPAGGANRRLTGATRKGMQPTNFATIVHHPGSKPYPFMLPGAKTALHKAGLLDRIVAAWNSAA